MKYNKITKKIAAICLAMTTFLTGAVSVSANTDISADGSYVRTFSYEYENTITSELVKSSLDSLMTEEGYIPGKKPIVSGNCWKFINNVSKRLYGFGIPGQKSDHIHLKVSDNWSQVGNSLSNAEGNLSSDSIKELFVNNVATGDIVQMDYTKTYDRNSDSLHVMIVYNVTPTGVVFLHAGSKVYFGRSNGKNPLYGSTGEEVTYEELYSYLKSDDDGFSVYRANNVIVSQPTESDFYITSEFKFPNNVCLPLKKSFGLRGKLYSRSGFEYVESKLYIKDFWGNENELSDFGFHADMNGVHDYSVKDTIGSNGVSLNDTVKFKRLYAGDYVIRFNAIDVNGAQYVQEYCFTMM